MMQKVFGNQNFSSASLKILQRAESILAPVSEGKILLALSGGADSVALLNVCRLLKVPFIAIHCNFHLRGAEADRDAGFVKNLCDRLDIELICIDFDTPEFMRLNPGISTEMACRQLRHSRFDEEAKKYNCVRIATGHNSSDNAETLMLNLLRGAGINGLKAMLPDDGRVIRPLISTSRSEILSFLKDLNQDYITDSSNLQSDFRRNFLRNEVFPLISQRWESWEKSFSKSISILQRQNKILAAAIRKGLGDDPMFLDYESINRFPDSLTLLLSYIQPFGGTADIAAEMNDSLPSPSSGKKWIIGKHIVMAERKGFRIIDTNVTSSMEIVWEKVAVTDSNRNELKTKICSSRDNSTAWLPLSPEHYELRQPYPGERVRLLGMKGSRLCSDIIAESGITYDKRINFHLLAMCPAGNESFGEAVWLPGMKRAGISLIDFDKARTLYKASIKS